MQVREWMTPDVRTCAPETSLAAAARAMWDGDCGILPVIDAGGRVVGMLTDRDACMGACMQGKRMEDARVRDSMSSTVFTCRATDSIEDAVRTMGVHQVRRVPVVDANGKLEGILSLNDVARRIAGLGDLRARARLVPRLVETMAAVCQPHVCTLIPQSAPGPGEVRRLAPVG
jgi:CBS-domain-containing membrane protein